VIDFREAEILKGQVTQAIHSIVGSEFPLAHFVEKFANGFGVQSSQRSARSI
jgi:hypothetical protein